MSIKEKGNIIKTKLKNNKYIGSIASYIVYWLETINIIDSSDSANQINHIWSGTQNEYDNLSETRDDTLYFIE